LQALRSGLNSGFTISDVWAVKSTKDYSRSSIPGIRHGVYFLAGALNSTRVNTHHAVAIWAFSADAYRTGGGIAIGAGPLAQGDSQLGASVSPTSPVYREMTADNEAYLNAEACVRQRGHVVI
jgi:hypothetical protein